MIQPTRVFQLAKEKTQQFRHSFEAERFTCRLDKFLTVYHGYSRLKPKIFPKRMSAMFPANVVVASEGQPQNFHPAFGTSASLKRHQQDWSDKYQRTRPGYAIAAGDYGPRTTRERDDSGKLHIVAGVEGQVDKRKVYGSIGRSRKPHTRSPRRVVLRAGEPCANRTVEQSSDILCSSVFLTYREGLFFNSKPQQQLPALERNCSDV
uniref:Uncharacterized protein n=1 Tax=Anopheles dirus TaxID=7168 RepID=A0A182NZC0_9DIPT